MKPLDRAEALLASLAREPKTFYALYRTTLGCAYTSLERALKELQGGGLIEEAKKEKIGREKNIHRNREGEATANTDQEPSPSNFVWFASKPYPYCFVDAFEVFVTGK